MSALKPWHIVVFVIVLVLLFGAKRLPDAARSLGRSLRIIKAETKGLVDDDNVAEKAEPQFSRQPLQGDAPQPGYQQQPYQPGYQQQPQPGHQQQPYQQQPYQQPPAGAPYQQPTNGQPQPQPYVDPVQRTNER